MELCVDADMDMGADVAKGVWTYEKGGEDSRPSLLRSAADRTSGMKERRILSFGRAQDQDQISSSYARNRNMTSKDE